MLLARTNMPSATIEQTPNGEPNANRMSVVEAATEVDKVCQRRRDADRDVEHGSH